MGGGSPPRRTRAQATVAGSGSETRKGREANRGTRPAARWRLKRQPGTATADKTGTAPPQHVKVEAHGPMLLHSSSPVGHPRQLLLSSGLLPGYFVDPAHDVDWTYSSRRHLSPELVRSAMSKIWKTLAVAAVAVASLTVTVATPASAAARECDAVHICDYVSPDAAVGPNGASCWADAYPVGTGSRWASVTWGTVYLYWSNNCKTNWAYWQESGSINSCGDLWVDRVSGGGLGAAEDRHYFCPNNGQVRYGYMLTAPTQSAIAEWQNGGKDSGGALAYTNWA